MGINSPKSSLLICHSHQHSPRVASVIFGGAGGRRGGPGQRELEGTWLRYRKTAESGLVLWESGGKKGWHSLRERFKLTLCGSLSPQRCRQTAEESEEYTTLRWPANLSSTGKARGLFLNGRSYLMSAYEWKWLATWGSGGTLMLQSPLKRSVGFFPPPSGSMAGLYFHQFTVLAVCGGHNCPIWL